MEECELLGDSKYRAYVSQVEKALKAFEATSEWADLISALGKLNKVRVYNMPIIFCYVRIDGYNTQLMVIVI